jgi:hypothetical protein
VESALVTVHLVNQTAQLAKLRVILITQHLTVLVTTSKANVSMFWLKTVESKTLLFTLRITSEVEPTSAGLKL